MLIGLKERVNALLPWMLLGSGVTIFFVVNLGISGMGLLGVAVNFLALCGLLAYFFWPQPQVLLGFFAANAILGPFLLVNLNGIDLAVAGRLDYMVALLVGVALIFQAERVSRPLLVFLITFSVLFLWGLLLDIEAEDDLVGFFGAWYASAGRLAVGIVMFRLVVATSKPVVHGSHLVARWVELIILTLLLMHVALSWLQLVVPVSLRTGTIDSGLNLFGFSLNRPTGLFEASYVYGVTSIGLWWIWRCLSGGSSPRMSVVLLVLLLPVSLIATRSVALGVILFALLAWWSSLKGVRRSFVMLMVFSAFGVIGLSFLPLLAALDQSNSTKVLLLWHTLATWVAEFPSLKSFLGYGYDQASRLAASSGFFDLAASLSAAYDNRIDEGTGFPIHNVYVQFFFEYGLLATIAVAWIIWRGLRNILLRRIDSATAFFWCIAVTHYAAHNGIFSSLLTLALLLGAFPQSIVAARHYSVMTGRSLKGQLR